jgi:hypothetical protein
MNAPSRDVFLCHTSADKRDFVEPVIGELQKRGITYWFDKAEVKWGDRISNRIDAGLRISRFVIIFLSENFIGHPWPEAELSSALSRENEKGEIVVLPLILGSKNVVLEKYQLLRGKRYLEWDDGVTTIVDELQSRLHQNDNFDARALGAHGKSPQKKDSTSNKELLSELLRLGAILSDLKDNAQRVSFASQLLTSFVNILMRKYDIPTHEDATDVGVFLHEVKRSQPMILKLRADIKRAGVSLEKLQDTVSATKNLLETRPIRAEFGEDAWHNLTFLFGTILNILGVGQDSEVSEVQRLIGHGESELIEFKASLQWDMKEHRINPDLRKAVAREVAGFMNSGGGTLLIGVTNEGDVVGLDNDLETIPGGDRDSLERLLYETVVNHCGKECYEYTKAKFVGVYDKTILKVAVNQSDKPMYFVDGEKVQLYVRIGNATRPFNVREAIEYYQLHWRKDQNS